MDTLAARLMIPLNGLIVDLHHQVKAPCRAHNKKIARLSLAIHENWKNEAGERVRETQWHQLVLWEKQAEIAEKFLVKGSEISIEGRLNNRSYTDKDGIKRYVTEVVVSEIQLPGKKQND
jgi:single-strand DNA-binding protein